MELKKNPKSDLRKWSGTFFNLGLAIGLASTLAAFEWKTYSSSPLLQINGVSDSWDDVVPPITIQDPPPPPTPVVFEEKPNDKVIDDISLPIIDIYEPITTEIPTVIIDMPPIIEDVDEIFTIVETQPNPSGGTSGWNKYLSDNLKYPTQARRMSIEGRVIVTFVVNTDGSIQDVKVLRGIGGGCDEEAVKVVENAPKWEPGKQRGRPVRTRMSLPIQFRLN